MKKLYDSIQKEHLLVFLIVLTALVLFNSFDVDTYTGLAVQEQCIASGYSCCSEGAGQGIHYPYLDDTCYMGADCWSSCGLAPKSNSLTGEGVLDTSRNFFFQLIDFFRRDVIATDVSSQGYNLDVDGDGKTMPITLWVKGPVKSGQKTALEAYFDDKELRWEVIQNSGNCKLEEWRTGPTFANRRGILHWDIQGLYNPGYCVLRVTEGTQKASILITVLNTDGSLPSSDIPKPLFGTTVASSTTTSGTTNTGTSAVGGNIQNEFYNLDTDGDGHALLQLNPLVIFNNQLTVLIGQTYSLPRSSYSDGVISGTLEWNADGGCSLTEEVLSITTEGTCNLEANVVDTLQANSPPQIATIMLTVASSNFQQPPSSTGGGTTNAGQPPLPRQLILLNPTAFILKGSSHTFRISGTNLQPNDRVFVEYTYGGTSQERPAIQQGTTYLVTDGPFAASGLIEYQLQVRSDSSTVVYENPTTYGISVTDTASGNQGGAQGGTPIYEGFTIQSLTTIQQGNEIILTWNDVFSNSIYTVAHQSKNYNVQGQSHSLTFNVTSVNPNQQVFVKYNYTGGGSTVPATKNGGIYTATLNVGSLSLGTMVSYVFQVQQGSSVVFESPSYSFTITKSADFDGNNCVDSSDQAALTTHFGAVQGGANYDARYDLNSDNQVNFVDFVLLAAQSGNGNCASGNAGTGLAVSSIEGKSVFGKIADWFRSLFGKEPVGLRPQEVSAGQAKYTISRKIDSGSLQNIHTALASQLCSTGVCTYRENITASGSYTYQVVPVVDATAVASVAKLSPVLAVVYNPPVTGGSTQPPTTQEICDNAVDNDGDGVPPILDPDCQQQRVSILSVAVADRFKEPYVDSQIDAFCRVGVPQGVTLQNIVSYGCVGFRVGDVVCSDTPTLEGSDGLLFENCNVGPQTGQKQYACFVNTNKCYARLTDGSALRTGNVTITHPEVCEDGVVGKDLVSVLDVQLSQSSSYRIGEEISAEVTVRSNADDLDEVVVRASLYDIKDQILVSEASSAEQNLELSRRKEFTIKIPTLGADYRNNHRLYLAVVVDSPEICMFESKSISLRKGSDAKPAVDNTTTATCVTGQTRDCGSDVGVCKTGLQQCISGVWSACVGQVSGATEVCSDKLDNDCDGRIDCLDPDCSLSSVCQGGIEPSVTDDADQDGLSDAWEERYFGDIALYGADDDPDEDGFSNLKEFVAGTNPNDASDKPKGIGGTLLIIFAIIVVLGIVALVVIKLLNKSPKEFLKGETQKKAQPFVNHANLERIESYIQNSLQKGYSKSQIREALLAKGWTKEEIQHAFNHVGQ